MLGPPEFACESHLKNCVNTMGKLVCYMWQESHMKKCVI